MTYILQECELIVILLDTVHMMSDNMKSSCPLGPPPSYDTTQDASTCSEIEIQDVINSSTKTPIDLEFEDPPPYKEKESPEDSVGSFQFLFPLITRPWKRFFSLCWRDRWSTSAENFGHNMTFYQMNYTWLLMTVVVVSLVM